MPVFSRILRACLQLVQLGREEAGFYWLDPSSFTSGRSLLQLCGFLGGNLRLGSALWTH